MNIKRALEDMAGEPAPVSRLDAEAAYLGGQRLRSRRQVRRLTLAGVGAAVTLSAASVAFAIAGRLGPGPADAPVSPSTPASATATAAPSTSPSVAVSQSPPGGSGATGGGTSSAASKLDCAKATEAVRASLREQGFWQEAVVTCLATFLTAKLDLVSSPVHVQLVVEVSLPGPPTPGAAACSGGEGLCEQNSMANLLRADGLQVRVSVSPGGSGQSSSEDVRDTVLSIGARL